MLDYFSDRTQNDITDHIRTRFLLAQLLMDSFRDKATLRDVKSALRNLPQGSDAYDVAYHGAMERILAQGKGSSKMAKKILAWILCARRPLHTLELLHALAVEPGDTEIDEDNILETEQLLTICAGLVTIDEQSNNVRFVHYTTQEYLQRNQETWLPDAKIEIARSCIAYLSIDGLAVGPCLSQVDYENRLRVFVLLEYASVYWGQHTNLLMGQGCEAALKEIATEAQFLLLDVKRLSTVNQVLFMSNSWKWSEELVREGEGFSGSHWIGRFGLLPLLKQWIDRRCELDQSDFRGRTPLSWAAEKGQEAMVKQLLDTKQVDVDSKDMNGWTPLSRAAMRGREAVVKQLLETGKVDVDSKDNNGRTPLSWAAERGQEATVKQLLDTKQVDVDSKDSNGRSPLSFAAQCGHESTAVLLLKNMSVVAAATESNIMIAKLNPYPNRSDCIPDTLGRTPSMWAALGGQLSCIQTLWPSQLPMSNSTTMDKDSLGLSIIHLFAIGNCSDGISLVLDAGFDVNETDSQGWTPLHWAAYFGHEEVSQFLVDRAADRGLKDLTGRTAYGVSLFVGAKQLNEVLKPHLVQDNPNVLRVAQEFSAAYCDSCQRVIILSISRSSFLASRANLFKTLIGHRHHCSSCDDFDLCFRCVLDVSKIHPQHQFDSEQNFV
jgi:ankyrin repeat protein